MIWCNFLSLGWYGVLLQKCTGIVQQNLGTAIFSSLPTWGISLWGFRFWGFQVWVLLWVLGPDVSQHSVSTSNKRARLAQRSKYGGGRGSSGEWRWWSQHEWQPSFWGAGWIFEQTNPVCENSLLYRPPKTLGSRCESEYALLERKKIVLLC